MAVSSVFLISLHCLSGCMSRKRPSMDRRCVDVVVDMRGGEGQSICTLL